MNDEFLVKCATTRKPKGQSNEEFLSKLLFLHLEGKGLATLVNSKNNSYEDLFLLSNPKITLSNKLTLFSFAQETLNLGLCSQLKVLFGGGNRIKSLSGVEVIGRNLIELYLQDNLIELVDPSVIQKLPALEKLILDNNSIASIDWAAFASCHRLRELHINGQRISGEITFQDSTKSLKVSSVGSLEFLSCTRNRIKHIPKTSILLCLSRLDLSNNELVGIDGIANELKSSCPNIVELNLEGNPVTRERKYREVLTLTLEKLSKLDGREITPNEREFLQHMKSPK